MAEGNNFKHPPKKFTRGFSEPTQINKFNYTGGCWNSPIPYNSSCAINPRTGQTAHPTNNLTQYHIDDPRRMRYNTFYSGWLYYIPYRLPENVTGKCFDIDFAYYAGPSYYDGYTINMWIDVAFYNESTRQWSGYYRLSGPHRVAMVNQSSSWLYTLTSSYRPRCGLACSPESLPVTFHGTGDPTDSEGNPLSTYSAFDSYLTSCGISRPVWDGSNESFMARPSHAVHYLSSNGYWSNGQVTITSDAASVRSHWVYSNPNDRTSDKLDGGNKLSSNPLRINISADYIKQCCGSLAAISKFKLRIWRGQESPSIYWDWPGDELPQWQALDNPQVGLLDYSEPTRHITDWPPRFDARAWYRNKTAPVQQPELMAMYNPGNGNWTIN